MPPPVEFASLTAARACGRATADQPHMRAHAFLLESEDGLVKEHWVRSESDPAVWAELQPDDDFDALGEPDYEDDEDEPDNGGEIW